MVAFAAKFDYRVFDRLRYLVVGLPPPSTMANPGIAFPPDTPNDPLQLSKA